jgi:membrane protease YdiL (CAAX protease family)
MNTKENKLEAAKILILFLVEVAIELLIGFIFGQLENAGIVIPTYLHVFILDICLLIPVFAYTIKKGDAIVEAFEFKKIKVSTFFFTILLVIVAQPMVMLANVVSQFFVPNVMVQAVDQFATESVGLTLIATVISAPITEEIVCRGFFANRLKKVFPFAVAAIFSGLMFGIIHLNLNQFCYATVLGIIFAYLNKASGSIFTSIEMHMVFNGLNMCMHFLTNAVMKAAGMDFAEAAEQSRTASSTVLTTAIVLAILSIPSFLLVRLIIRTIAKREGNLETK